MGPAPFILLEHIDFPILMHPHTHVSGERRVTWRAIINTKSSMAAVHTPYPTEYVCTILYLRSIKILIRQMNQPLQPTRFRKVCSQLCTRCRWLRGHAHTHTHTRRDTHLLHQTDGLHICSPANLCAGAANRSSPPSSLQVVG